MQIRQDDGIHHSRPRLPSRNSDNPPVEENGQFNRFQGHFLQSFGKINIDAADLDARAYAKYVLREGGVSEKRELLGNLRSRLVYMNKERSLS